MKKSHTHPLSKGEVALLSSNPYVVKATSATVKFSEEFKQLAYANKRKGISVAQTLREHGIDPDILGESRVEGFSYTLSKKARHGTDFSDRRTDNHRHTGSSEERTMEQRIRQLEHELAYTRQEVAFLKKLQLADMEGRKA